VYKEAILPASIKERLHLVGELLQNLDGVTTRARNPVQGWEHLSANRLLVQPQERQLPAFGAQMIGINLGAAFKLKRELNGRVDGGESRPGQVTLYPYDGAPRWTILDPADALVLYLDQSFIDRTFEEANGHDPAKLEIAPHFLLHDPMIERIGYDLLREMQAPQFGTHLLVESLTLSLTLHLLRQHSNRRCAGQMPSGLSRQRLARVTEFITANLDSDITLSAMAEAAGMSPFHFARSFRRVTGRTPHGYLAERRLEQARLLLHDRRLSIQEVAAAIGIRSPSHFSAFFARHMGTTPTQFRKVILG